MIKKNIKKGLKISIQCLSKIYKNEKVKNQGKKVELIQPIYKLL